MDPNAAMTPSPQTPSLPMPSGMQFDADTMSKIQQARQAGYSDSDIYAKAVQYQQSKGGTQPSSNSLLDWLPAVGGIGGSLLGTGLGPLGTIGGGAAGSALGDFLKQAIEGKQINPGEVAGQGVIGGVGGAAGEVLSPLFKLGGGLISKILPDALDNTGAGFVASQYNVPRSMARALNLNDTIQALSGYGLHNINDIVPAAEKVTGGNGILTQITRNAISQASPVDTAGIRQMAEDMTSIMPTTGDQKILNFVDKQLTSMNGGAQGSITQANPLDVFDSIQQFEQAANTINKVAGPARTVEATNTANIYRQIANELKDRLFSGQTDAAGNMVSPGADAAVASGVVTPEQLAALQQISPKLAQEVQAAQTVGDIRGLAAPFVKGSQLANETEAGSQIGFNNVAGAVKGVGKMVQNPLNLLAVPLGSDTVNAGVGGGAQSLADILRSLPTGNPALLSALAKGTGQVGAQDFLGGNNQQATSMPTSEMAGGFNGGVTTPSGLPDNNMNISPYNQKINSLRNLIGTLMFVMPRQGADLKNAFDFLYPGAAQSANSALNVQHTAGMMNVIDKMLQTAPQASGIGPFANIIQHAEQKTGLFGGGDPATLQLQADAMLLKQMIATEVHRRGMSAEALQAMNDAFPDPTESHGTFIAKLANLKNVLGTYFGEYGNSIDPTALPAVSPNYSTTPAGAFGY